MKKFYWSIIAIAAMLINANMVMAVDVFVNTAAQLVVACNNAASGDVIKIAPGTYNGPFRLIGKSNVTLQSDGGNVYLQGNLDPSQQGIAILQIENSSNITVTGLKFHNSWGDDAGGIYIKGSGNSVSILNCEFYDTGKLLLRFQDKTSVFVLQSGFKSFRRFRHFCRFFFFQHGQCHFIDH